MSSGDVVVAVLGLGEAGGAIARDLVAAGVTVRAYDPAVTGVPGAVGCASEAEAVAGAVVVVSLTTAEAAHDALRAALPGLAPTTIWADRNTASPSAKRALAALREAPPRSAAAGAAGASAGAAGFADVALMAPVPGRGLRTPMLASGPAASGFAAVMAPLGASVSVLDGPPGAAAERKLLRSVFFKGMAAAVVEALLAARAAGLEPWMRDLIATELTGADAAFADRLETGTYRHAARRADEMAAATELLDTLGVPPRIAGASRDWLRDLA